MTSTLGLISHIEINVSDLSKSKEFWKYLLEELGYTKYQDWSQGISWKLEETYIVFVQTQEKYSDTPYHRSGTGLNHIAFYVDTKEKIDKIALELEKNGVNLLYNDRFRKQITEDPYGIFFEDPDRIKVELVISN